MSSVPRERFAVIVFVAPGGQWVAQIVRLPADRLTVVVFPAPDLLGQWVARVVQPDLAT